MAQQTHRSNPQLLNSRTLERDHRVLAGLLGPGMSVLDVGCGTGAITEGIARAVAPGEVIGIDRDASLLPPSERFVAQDALTMEFEGRFDVVTAARAVQWMTDPAEVVRRMARAAKRGGLVVVLDYNHRDNAWKPAPPIEFRRCYDQFLAWREQNGWNNAIADRLPELFAAAGLTGIETHISDEIDGRGASLWLHVIESIGPKFMSAAERSVVASLYEEYIHTRLDRQTLAMRTVVGRAAV
jgi:SAM-dependent methyltransferase